MRLWTSVVVLAAVTTAHGWVIDLARQNHAR
jgi:hypothetical protein